MVAERIAANGAPGQEGQQSRDLKGRMNAIDLPASTAFNDRFDKLARTQIPASFTRDTSADCHRLASLTLEITREPVTRGRVENLIDWYSGYPEPPLARPKDIFRPTEVGSAFRHGDFIRR